jgi:hypothetical protein
MFHNLLKSESMEHVGFAAECCERETHGRGLGVLFETGLLEFCVCSLGKRERTWEFVHLDKDGCRTIQRRASILLR